MGLAEKRIVKAFQEGPYKKYESQIHEVVGKEIEIDVNWDSLSKGGSSDLWEDSFPKVYFIPLIDALKSICADDMGKEAIAESLTKIIIENNGNWSSSSWSSFSDGVLKLDNDPITNIDSTQARAESLQKVLENNLEPKNLSFEEQFEIFKELGFELNSGVDKSDIERWDEEDFIDEPFSLMYITLGQTIECEPWTPLTNKCWEFDTETIEGHGSYVDIIKNLERITRGNLKFENVKDYVDIEEEEAWVSFTFNGKDYKWDLKVDNDWADIDLFSKIVNLTENNKFKGQYTYFDTEDQNAVIGFETSESLKQIKDKTGLKIEWLN